VSLVVGAEHCHQIRGHDALVGIEMGLGLDLDLELVREQTGRVLELVGLLLGHEESGRLQVAFPHVSDLWELLLLVLLLLVVVVVKVVEEWLLAGEVVGVVVVGGVVLVVALGGVECVLVGLGEELHLKVEVGQVAARQCGVVAVVVVVVVVVGVVLEVVVLVGH